MKIAIIGIIAVIIILGGSYAVLRKAPNMAASSNGQSQSTQSSTNKITPDTITYSSNGFSPSVLTVKAGSVVTIRNTATDTMQLASDPHPLHTDDTDLNVGLVEPGRSKTFIVSKKGTFGYHNHLDPSERGTVTIN